MKLHHSLRLRPDWSAVAWHDPETVSHLVVYRTSEILGTRQGNRNGIKCPKNILNHASADTSSCLLRCSQEDGQCECLPNMIGRHCSDPAPGYFLPSLDYFLYEAELAALLNQGSSTSSTTTSSLVCNTKSALDSQIVCTVLVFVLFCGIFRWTQHFYHSVSSTSRIRVLTLSSITEELFWFGGLNNLPAGLDWDRWASGGGCFSLTSSYSSTDIFMGYSRPISPWIPVMPCQSFLFKGPMVSELRGPA